MAVIRKYNSQKVYYQAVTNTTTKTDILMTDLGLKKQSSFVKKHEQISAYKKTDVLRRHNSHKVKDYTRQRTQKCKAYPHYIGSTDGNMPVFQSLT